MATLFPHKCPATKKVHWPVGLAVMTAAFHAANAEFDSPTGHFRIECRKKNQERIRLWKNKMKLH